MTAIRFTAKTDVFIEVEKLELYLSDALRNATGVDFAVSILECEPGSYSDDLTVNVMPMDDAQLMDEDHEPDADVFGFIGGPYAD